MRRTGHNTDTAFFQNRFISAYAENSFHCRARRMYSSVHLRVCGEQAVMPIGKGMVAGSSPRMRRTGHGRPHGQLFTRFISAYAENRDSGTSQPPDHPVHLRVCGEQPTDPVCSPINGGSSPRMRRTGISRLIYPSSVRFISAYAENRVRLRLENVIETVHLRVCGEQ